MAWDGHGIDHQCGIGMAWHPPVCPGSSEWNCHGMASPLCVMHISISPAPPGLPIITKYSSSTKDGPL